MSRPEKSAAAAKYEMRSRTHAPATTAAESRNAFELTAPMIREMRGRSSGVMVNDVAASALMPPTTTIYARRPFSGPRRIMNGNAITDGKSAARNETDAPTAAVSSESSPDTAPLAIIEAKTIANAESAVRKEKIYCAETICRLEYGSVSAYTINPEESLTENTDIDTTPQKSPINTAMDEDSSEETSTAAHTSTIRKKARHVVNATQM